MSTCVQAYLYIFPCSPLSLSTSTSLPAPRSKRSADGSSLSSHACIAGSMFPSLKWVCMTNGMKRSSSARWLGMITRFCNQHCKLWQNGSKAIGRMGMCGRARSRYTHKSVDTYTGRHVSCVPVYMSTCVRSICVLVYLPTNTGGSL